MSIPISFQRSPSGSFTFNPFGARNLISNGKVIEVRNLVNVKQWNGFRPNGEQWNYSGASSATVNALYGFSTPPASNSTMALLRQRYRTRSISYSGSWDYGSGSTLAYSCTDTMTGDAASPSSAGCPSSIEATAPTPGVMVAVGSLSLVPSAPGPWLIPMTFAAVPSFASGTVGSLTWTGNQTTADSGTVTESVTVTYSSEITFGSILTIACDRLSARSDWPAWESPDDGTVPANNAAYERWHEWGDSSMSLDFDTYAYSGPLTGDPTAPYFAENQPVVGYTYDAYRQLASGWVYTDDYDIAGIPDTGALEVFAMRAEFKAYVNTSYWIGHAYCRSYQDVGYGRDPQHVTIYKPSTLAAAGEIVKLPFPSSRDFSTVDSLLMRGEFYFAIIAETPSAWSARTGITIY